MSPTAGPSSVFCFLRRPNEPRPSSRRGGDFGYRGERAPWHEGDRLKLCALAYRGRSELREGSVQWQLTIGTGIWLTSSIGEALKEDRLPPGLGVTVGLAKPAPMCGHR